MTMKRSTITKQSTEPYNPLLERPYKVKWEFTGKTTKEFVAGCRSITGSCEPVFPFDEVALVQDIKDHVTSACATELIQQAQAEGIDMAILNVQPWANITKRYVTTQFRDYAIVTAYATLNYGGTIEFESSAEMDLEKPTFNVPLSSERLPLLLWWQWILALIVGAIVAAYTIALIIDWLKSMTTTTTKTETTIHYPDCKTETTTKEITEPSFIGIIAVGMVLIGALIIIPMLTSKGKRQTE
jgi:hypothetical protein